MANFDFARQTLPALHADCVRAESYLTSDPRAACFYARRALNSPWHGSTSMTPR